MLQGPGKGIINVNDGVITAESRRTTHISTEIFSTVDQMWVEERDPSGFKNKEVVTCMDKGGVKLMEITKIYHHDGSSMRYGFRQCNDLIQAPYINLPAVSPHEAKNEEFVEHYDRKNLAKGEGEVYRQMQDGRWFLITTNYTLGREDGDRKYYNPEGRHFATWPMKRSQGETYFEGRLIVHDIEQTDKTLFMQDYYLGHQHGYQYDGTAKRVHFQFMGEAVKFKGEPLWASYGDAAALNIAREFAQEKLKKKPKNKIIAQQVQLFLQNLEKPLEPLLSSDVNDRIVQRNQSGKPVFA